MDQVIPLADAFVILHCSSYGNQYYPSHSNIINVYPPKASSSVNELNLVMLILT